MATNVKLVVFTPIFHADIGATGHGCCGHNHEEKTALDILKKRYAKGEKNKE